jgi:hypothetical protein
VKYGKGYSGNGYFDLLVHSHDLAHFISPFFLTTPASLFKTSISLAQRGHLTKTDMGLQSVEGRKKWLTRLWGKARRGGKLLTEN